MRGGANWRPLGTVQAFEPTLMPAADAFVAARDIVGFDRSGFGDNAVPDDIMQDGERLLTAIDEYTDADGKLLAYRDTAFAQLETALNKAQAEWSEAEASDSTYQQGLVKVRETGATFDIELQAFRQAPGVVAGRSIRPRPTLRHLRDRGRTGEPATGWLPGAAACERSVVGAAALAQPERGVRDRSAAFGTGGPLPRPV